MNGNVTAVAAWSACVARGGSDGPWYRNRDVCVPSGKGARTDEGRIRAAAVQHGVPCITTLAAAEAAVRAMRATRDADLEVESLQSRYAKSL